MCFLSDNDPQFSSAKFKSFCIAYKFRHVTSSLHYPEPNEKAENAVMNMKSLFKKARASRSLEFLAQLEWRITPTEGVGTSPAQ